MKKKILILPIIVILILFGISFIFWFKTVKDIRKEVSAQLRENLEFCEIVKDQISPPKGKFWLICNGRPFYANYENGKLNYELNGWGFLKEQPEILNELREEGCNFYDFSENKLTFVCQNKKVKFFQFSTSDFKLKKIGEDLTINQLSELIRSKYDCSILGETGFEIDEEKFFKLIADCQGKKTIFNFNLEKRYFTLPIVIDGEIQNKEKAEFSFQLINVCKKDYIQEMERDILLGMDCNIGKPIIIYDFDLEMAKFLIPVEEFESLFPYLGRFNLENMAGIELKYLKSVEKNGQILKYYLAKERVIVGKEEKGSNLISEVYFKNEGIR